MSASLVFSIVNPLALVGWILLIFFPDKKSTKFVVKSGALPVVLSLVYLVALVTGSSGFVAGGSFASLEGVKVLFQNDWALLAGWVHYLAFDLLVGVQAQKKLEERSLAVRFVCLFSIFMLGPIGYVLTVSTDFLRTKWPK